jgi:carbon-monoxide dehydrogenase large subunit
MNSPRFACSPGDAVTTASAEEIDIGADHDYFVDNAALVSGEGAFIADVNLPGMLEIAFLRSPLARAKIVSIDTSAAETLPGVAKVLVGGDAKLRALDTLPRASRVLHASEDAPEAFHLPAYRLLPEDAVNYEGEVVALVAAESRYIAEDAVELIDVEFDERTPILDPEQSLRPEAEQIYADVSGNLALEGHYGSSEDPGPLFEDAPVVIERRYRMNRSGNPPLETIGVVANYENRVLTVWSTIQRPHMLRIALADILELPISRVRVVAPPNIGGGFGWKSPMYRETATVAWLAVQLGRPVRWIEDRTEALKKGIHERDQIWDMKAAFSHEGMFLGLQSEVVADVGSVMVDMYGLLPARISVSLPFPYHIPWLRTHLRCAITNKAPMGVNRPAGRLPAVWAIERLMDDAARAVGISPLEIRMKNFVRQFPYRSPLGGSLTDSDYVATTNKLLEVFDYAGKQKEAARLRSLGRRVGIGISGCVELCRPQCSSMGALFYNQPNYASVALRMHPDGSVSVFSGDAPQGQMRHSTMAAVVARELGADPSMVDVVTGDTFLSPITNSNTDVTSVCALAARRLRTKMLEAASHILGTDSGESGYEMAHGIITHRADGRTISFRDLAWTVMMTPFKMPPEQPPELSVVEYLEAPYSPTSFCAHAAMVEVDPETGKLTILSYGLVGDCGKPLNPRGLRSAITAGIATGISNTTHEAYIYDSEGQLITSNLKDYAMLTAGEMPKEIIIDHHNVPTGATFYGHKRTITEGVPTGVPAVLINAIIDAYEGAVDIPTIPVFPGDIWRSLRREQA